MDYNVHVNVELLKEMFRGVDLYRNSSLVKL